MGYHPLTNGMIAFSAHEAPDYFTIPGYLAIENGWALDANGTVMIAVRSEIPDGELSEYTPFGVYSI